MSLECIPANYPSFCLIITQFRLQSSMFTSFKQIFTMADFGPKGVDCNGSNVIVRGQAVILSKLLLFGHGSYFSSTSSGIGPAFARDSNNAPQHIYRCFFHGTGGCNHGDDSVFLLYTREVIRTLGYSSNKTKHKNILILQTI